MKSGTTQLTTFLSQHPSIGLFQREIHFFDKQFDKGIDYYRRILPIKTNSKILVGECSPNYIYKKEVPGRVFALYPNIKLILILREPVARSYSHYQMKKQYFKENRSFEDAILFEKGDGYPNMEDGTPPAFPYLQNSLYVNFLKHWLDFFSSSQILILFSENLKEKPLETLNKVCSFLNIADFSKMPIEDKTLFQSYPPIKKETKQALQKFFEPYNLELESLIGEHLPWIQESSFSNLESR